MKLKFKGSGMGSFLQGFTSGAFQGMQARSMQAREKRSQEEFDLRKREMERRWQEAERQNQAWRDLSRLIDEYDQPQAGGAQTPQLGSTMTTPTTGGTMTTPATDAMPTPATDVPTGWEAP